MRAFLALWPPEPVRRALFAWGQACRAAAGGRLAGYENLHATLAFLGEIAPDRLASLATLVREAAGRRFELVFDEVGYWPHNRIVYAGATEMPVTLSQLASELRLLLAHAGFRTEERPYRAHVTLLRAARKAPAGICVEPLHWPVDGIVLMESIHGEGGLAYRTVERWTLAH